MKFHPSELPYFPPSCERPHRRDDEEAGCISRPCKRRLIPRPELTHPRRPLARFNRSRRGGANAP